MVILLQQQENGEFAPYRCKLSGRSQFDFTEGYYKARWLVQHRYTPLALVMEGEKTLAIWRWNETQQSAVKEYGPDL